METKQKSKSVVKPYLLVLAFSFLITIILFLLLSLFLSKTNLRKADSFKTDLMSIELVSSQNNQAAKKSRESLAKTFYSLYYGHSEGQILNGLVNLIELAEKTGYDIAKREDLLKEELKAELAVYNNSIKKPQNLKP